MSSFQFTHYKYDLLIGADATVEQLGQQEVCKSYVWNIEVCLNNLTPGAEDPVITVEYSNDGVKWHQWNSCATNQTDDSVAFFDNILPFLYIRVNYQPNGATTGTVDAKLILKKA